jgi:hypothetical protein
MPDDNQLHGFPEGGEEKKRMKGDYKLHYEPASISGLGYGY